MPAELPVIDPAAASEFNTGPVRFHLSLNVNDLAKSIAFFTVLFERPPAKHEPDYAKFELEEPALVLSLEPNRAPAAGKLNHLGIRLASTEALVTLQRRLEMAGIASQREEGIECCYSRQTKFWITDPDGNLWEMYTLDEDLDHRGMGQLPPATMPGDGAARNAHAPAPAVWAHRLGETFPAQILVHAGDVDTVFLQGTFNACLTTAQRRTMLTEAFRVLKSGGEVLLHQPHGAQPGASAPKPIAGSGGDRRSGPLGGRNRGRPGSGWLPADRVRQVGRLSLHHTADGIECRETRLVGYKPIEAGGSATLEVLYKGPFRELTDDQGRVFKRGKWTTVDEATFTWLKKSELAGQFVLPQ